MERRLIVLAALGAALAGLGVIVVVLAAASSTTLAGGQQQRVTCGGTSISWTRQSATAVTVKCAGPSQGSYHPPRRIRGGDEVKVTCSGSSLSVQPVTTKEVQLTCAAGTPPTPTPNSPTSTLPRTPTRTNTHVATATKANTPTPTQTPTPTATPTAPPSSGTSPMLGGCPVFPSDNSWNQRVDSLPVDSRSAAYIASINSTRTTVHPDFGSNPTYGIPFIIVPQNEPLKPITFTAYGDESDPGPYPVPTSAPIEGGTSATGDRHVIAVQQGTCELFEMFRAFPTASGWNADAGAVFDLRSNALRPEGWTSADAAGLPILPGLVRYDEVKSGQINHALRFTVSRTQRAYIHPAVHWASSSTDQNLPPMGLRLRLRADYNISGFTGDSRVILEALKKYGMIVADNGSSWFITGAADSHWNDTDLNQLKSVPGSAFEVVTTGTIVR